MKKLLIHDTTLRDGAQSPGVNFSLKNRIDIASLLFQSNVDILEAGFPFASAIDFAAVRQISEIFPNRKVAAFARGRSADIDSALTALKSCNQPRILVATPTSELHVTKQLRVSLLDALDLTSASLKHACLSCMDVEWVAIDAFRADISYLADHICAAIEAGATSITLADSVGIATPYMVKNLFSILFEKIPVLNSSSLNFGVHFHNDFGLATANSIEALVLGADLVHTTVNGLGERAGNAAMEEILAVVCCSSSQLPGDNIYSDFKFSNLSEISKLVANSSNRFLPPGKPIVGSSVTSHSSGMHQDAMLKDSQTYQAFDPSIFGLSPSSILLSKQSGRSAIRAKLTSLNLPHTDDQVERLFYKIRHFESPNGLLSDTDFRDLFISLS